MTKGRFNHLQLNVSGQPVIDFYKEMLTYLEYETLFEMEGFLGMSDGAVSVWVSPAPQQAAYNRDTLGLNHYGFHMENRDGVDSFISEFMQPKGISPILETPRERPDFRPAPEEYYQVLFTDPDGLLIEVYHTK